MKQIILSGILFLSIVSFTSAQSQPLSSNLFLQQDKAEDTEIYQCIQIRRGDKITLTGRLSVYDNDEDLNYLILSSDGGRIFLLKGDLIPDLKNFFLSHYKTEKIILKGTILFEGLDRRPAELEVSSFDLSKND
ncbi:MAG: hypothetical protein PF693_06965 [Spirochaetia bacterium]|nr:hypothetical protein [Spirochaetia bacterium]